MQRCDNGHWEPPGGVLELGEINEEGLRREVREETGTDIEPGALTGVYKKMTRVVAHVFRCKAIGGHLSTRDEAAAFSWASQQHIPKIVTEVYAIRMLDGFRETCLAGAGSWPVYLSVITVRFVVAHMVAAATGKDQEK